MKINPFAQQFRYMNDVMSRNSHLPGEGMKLILKEKKPEEIAAHPRTYNLPNSKADFAVILQGSGGIDEPTQRDIVVHLKILSLERRF